MLHLPLSAISPTLSLGTQWRRYTSTVYSWKITGYLRGEEGLWRLEDLTFFWGPSCVRRRPHRFHLPGVVSVAIPDGADAERPRHWGLNAVGLALFLPPGTAPFLLSHGGRSPSFPTSHAHSPRSLELGSFNTSQL